jgi:hypothetical protein
MSSSIPQAFVHEFANNVFHLGQQKVSRLFQVANVKYASAEKFHWDTLAAANMAAKASRLAATPVLNIAHGKRVATGTTYAWGEAIDANDAAQALIDPRSAYTQAASAAFGRQIDSVITTAATATAATGVGGGGTGVALPASQQIGGTGGATGAGQKLTVAGLRRAKQLMDEAEVSENRWLILSAKFLQDLLAVTEVVSSDYNTIKALVMGEVDTFLGFKFIRTEQIQTNTGNRKWVLAVAENAIGLGISQDRRARVAEDPGASFATRVYLETTMGAVRIEDKGVVALDCDTTA